MTNDSSWKSSGEADNLLAGIFDDIAEAAEREQEDTQKRVRSHHEELKTNELREQENRRQAAATRLNAESDRKQEAIQRRTARMQALEIEELKAQGKWVDPEEADRRAREAEAKREREREERRAELAQQQAAQQAQARVPKVAANDERVSWLPKLAVALIAAVCILGLYSVLQSGYDADPKTYSKSFRTPEIVTVATLEMDTQMLPQETAPVVASTTTDASSNTRQRTKSKRRKARSRKASKSKSSAAKKKKKKKKKNRKADELENLINGANPFGSSY